MKTELKITVDLPDEVRMSLEDGAIKMTDLAFRWADGTGKGKYAAFLRVLDWKEKKDNDKIALFGSIIGIAATGIFIYHKLKKHSKEDEMNVISEDNIVDMKDYINKKKEVA